MREVSTQRLLISLSTRQSNDGRVRERREMLIAAGDSPHGRKILYIGRMDENIESLRDDKPILRRLDDVGGEAVPGLEDWTLVVFGPEDTARFIARVGEDKHEGTA
jgi:hypothetical protein